MKNTIQNLLSRTRETVRQKAMRTPKPRRSQTVSHKQHKRVAQKPHKSARCICKHLKVCVTPLKCCWHGRCSNCESSRKRPDETTE